MELIINFEAVNFQASFDRPNELTMTSNLLHVKANIFKLKRVVIATSHDFTFIAQKIHKFEPDSRQIWQQVHGLVCDFLDQHVNFLDLLGAS